MNNRGQYRGQWLMDFDGTASSAAVDGLVRVHEYDKTGLTPEEVAIMEKAAHYRADAVFFEAPRDGRPPVAQAFIYRSGGPAEDPNFAQLHRQLWSWGGVPLVYRVTRGLVQLFRCAHQPDFEVKGEIRFKPFKFLKTAAKIASDPWWDAEQLRNGTLWDDPLVCSELLSSNKSAQKTLIQSVKELNHDINKKGILPRQLGRKLLILSILIKYLEARRVFEEGYFAHFLPGAGKFFEVLGNGPALLDLLDQLEERFNGHVFVLDDDDRDALRASDQLALFARFIEAKREASGQLTLWERYSFADLPVEIISHIYQLFVTDSRTAVYTPHFLVRLMLGEVLNWDRLDRLERNNEIILDPACGSGIFLVEAYKRLVLHWRSRNGWVRPSQDVLKELLIRVHGVDLEAGAVELAAFSLCLALCDALEPEEIRVSVKLFPELKEKTIHTGCFFEASERGMVKERVGVIVGNPPFRSSLRPGGEQRAYLRYQKEHGTLPDKQLAYLFLHYSMEMLVPGGVLSMLQQYNFLYNQQSLGFRRKFIERWDVREILDFISVRGLFQKGGADTKVIVVVAEAVPPLPRRQILHVTFRRSGRADAEQGFDIDYYDMHWLPRELALKNDGVWRTDLVGGGRVLGFVDRIKPLRTLGGFAKDRKWDCGEGFIYGRPTVAGPAKHIVGKQCIDSASFRNGGVDLSRSTIVPDRKILRPRKPCIYTAPLLMIHKHMDIIHGYLPEGYITYQHEIFGISAASQNDGEQLLYLAKWLHSARRPLLAYIAASSVAGFVSKATAILSDDIKNLPYPSDVNLKLTPHEQILVDDIVDYYRDLIRLGEKSDAMREPGVPALSAFNDTFTERINAVYRNGNLRALPHRDWSGVICQPYVFGEGKVDWTGAAELKDKLDALLLEKRGANLNVTRIARLYAGACIYLIKPNRLRYWLRSIALRDADETLADLWEQGF